MPQGGGVEPTVLGAQQNRDPLRPRDLPSGNRPRPRLGADQRDAPPPLEAGQDARPVAADRIGHTQYMAHGDPDRLAIQGIARGRVEDDAVDAERGGVAKETAEVVDVGDALGEK